MSCHQASLMLFDSQTHRLSCKRVWGFEALPLSEPRLVVTENVSKWMYEGGELLALAEEQGDRFLMIFDPEESRRFQCELRLPFYVRGSLVGVLSLGQKADGTECSAHDLDVLRVLMCLWGVTCLEKFLTCSERRVDRREQAPGALLSGRSGFRVKDCAQETELLGQSAAMQAVQELIAEVAPRDVPVLITGASGTGKRS